VEKEGEINTVNISSLIVDAQLSVIFLISLLFSDPSAPTSPWASRSGQPAMGITINHSYLGYLSAPGLYWPYFNLTWPSERGIVMSCIKLYTFE
jgi:hypothetical protein